MRNLVYRLSSSFPLTADLVRHLEGRISVFYPEEKSRLSKKVGAQLINIYAIVLVAVAILFLFADISAYYVAIGIATAYVVADWYIHKNMNKLELKLLKELLRFIEAVKFRFQFDGMLEEALFDAIGNSSYIMSIHGQIMYDCLKDSYLKDKCNYEEASPNQYFLTFYSLCESVMKYGDKKLDTGSLFLKNLGYLKEDINNHILKRNSIENEFMGLLWICILPIYCIKPIEMWAVGNMPELSETYSGTMGIMITLILTALSVGIYFVISNLKYPSSLSTIRKGWVIRLERLRVIRSINAKYMNCFIKRMAKLNLLLRAVAYPYNIAQFNVKRFANSIVTGLICGLIMLSMGFGVVSLLFVSLCTVFVFWSQVAIIKLKKQLMLMEREDEIIRFQGIILMLMHADKITVEQILSQLERFAINFKRDIEEISDKLSFKGMAIFKEIMSRSDFVPFNRLLEGFMACDDMYIHKAFEDVESDRRYYIEKHKQENVHYISQRSAIGKFLSFIPICTVVIAKLVVPFVMEGMRQMAVGNMIL